MHKLDLNNKPLTHSENTSSNPTSGFPATKSPVDEEASSADNLESSSGSSSTSSRKTESARLRPIEAPGTAKTKQNGQSRMKKPSAVIIIMAVVIAVGAGTATGYGSYQLSTSGANSGISGGSELQQVAGESVSAGDVFGTQDSETFENTAQGYLEAGGFDGEGSHKLLRPGGESQTVYLTSSVTDLDKLLGMEVKIWGETFRGQQVGWLMDVGRVEVLNPNAQPPEEE